MMKSVLKLVAILAVLVSLGVCFTACEQETAKPAEPVNEVKRATVHVQTGLDGLTVEQKNIGNRLLADNKPGAVQHLYVISAYSGQVIMYSTVAGKVTSSSKKLTPNTVAAADGQYVGTAHWGCEVNIRGRTQATNEVMQDDGTYGSSEPYIYWWDTKGVYHQHYVSGGQIIHISNSPIAVKGVILNLSAVTE